LLLWEKQKTIRKQYDGETNESSATRFIGTRLDGFALCKAVFLKGTRVFPDPMIAPAAEPIRNCLNRCQLRNEPNKYSVFNKMI